MLCNVFVIAATIVYKLFLSFLRSARCGSAPLFIYHFNRAGGGGRRGKTFVFDDFREQIKTGRKKGKHWNENKAERFSRLSECGSGQSGETAPTDHH